MVSRTISVVGGDVIHVLFIFDFVELFIHSNLFIYYSVYYSLIIVFTINDINDITVFVIVIIIIVTFIIKLFNC